METTNTQVEAALYNVTAKVIVDTPHTFVPQDRIAIGINGDLTGDDASDFPGVVRTWRQTRCPTPPALSACRFRRRPTPRSTRRRETIMFTQGSQEHVRQVAPGTVTPVSLPSGTYRSVSASCRTTPARW